MSSSNCATDVSTEDGYIYDFEKNKLRHANGNRIRLPLPFVCHQIGHEMVGIALRYNTITFRTTLSHERFERYVQLL